MRRILVLSLCLIALVDDAQGQSTPQQQSQQEIRTQVRNLITATNYDVMATLDLYVRSQRVSSINDETIIRGWRALSKQTEASVPSQGSFFVRLADVDVTMIGPDHALAIAPLTMEYQTDGGRVHVPGSMTLAFERTESGWKILHEHYSTGLDQETLASMAQQASSADSGVAGFLGLLLAGLAGDPLPLIAELVDQFAGSTCRR